MFYSAATGTALAGPRLWNNLLAQLRQPDIKLEEFRRLLKNVLLKPM